MQEIKLILALLLCFGFANEIYSQSLECSVSSSEEEIKYMPHFGNNKILDEVLKRTLPNGINKDGLGGSSPLVPFRIPIKVWRYTDDNGGNPSLSLNDVSTLIDEVNLHFANSGTGIRFYLKCAVETVNSTQFNSIGSEAEYDLMKQTNYDAKALNWHLVRLSTGGFSGIGTFPWKANNFTFMVAYNNSLTESRIGTTVHEIGHALGLLHTHEARDGSWNGEAGNCYQESVSRSKKQGAFCVSTAFKKKCEVNGDYLCTTAAAPNTEANSGIDIDSNCNYTGSGTDNWGDTWNPPTINYMSYLDVRTCRDQFDGGQVGVMHSNIILYAHNGIIIAPGEPWYNKDVISLSGTVFNGQTEEYYAPVSILAPDGGNSYVLNSGADVMLWAQENIKLSPGFIARSGSEFHAKVDEFTDCSIASNLNGEKQKLRMDDYADVRERLLAAIASQDAKQPAKEAINATLGVNVFPNPNNGQFTIKSEEPMISWQLRNQIGTLYLNNKIKDKSFSNDKVDITDYPSGFYFVKVVLESGKIITKTIIKE